MRVRWYGHSAFALVGSTTVFVDPFDAAELSRGRGSPCTRAKATRRPSSSRPRRSRLGIRCGRHHADRLTERDRVAGGDRELRHDARPVRGRARSPSSSPRRCRSPRPPRPRRPRRRGPRCTVPCIGLTTVSRAAAARRARGAPRGGGRARGRPARARSTATSMRRPSSSTASGAARDVRRPPRRRRRPAARAPRRGAPAPPTRPRRGRSRPRRSTGARAARGGSRRSVFTPPISNSSSARSIRRRALSRSVSQTISFAIIGS